MTSTAKELSSLDKNSIESTLQNAKEKIIKEVELRNCGKKKILFRLKDWGISRQRYWGCPIPVIYLEDGSVKPVNKSELPVLLPDDIDLNSNGNPLEKHPSWKITTDKETGSISTFVEKEGTYLNLEGRVQRTEIALATPDLARSDINIVRALSEYNMLESSSNAIKSEYLEIENNKISFAKNLFVKPSLSKKIFKNSFKGVISDFFLTNGITNNSKIMAKCSANF